MIQGTSWEGLLALASTSGTGPKGEFSSYHWDLYVANVAWNTFSLFPPNCDPQKMWQQFSTRCPQNADLVGGWTNPFEKYARQIGSSPQGKGVNKKNVWVATT